MRAARAWGLGGKVRGGRRRASSANGMGRVRPQVNPLVAASPVQALAAGTVLCVPACVQDPNPSNDPGSAY